MSVNLSATIDRQTLLALVDASHAINGDLGVPEMFDRIAEQAANVLRAAGASVMLLDESGKYLYFKTATGPAGDQLRGQRMPADEGIAGQTIKSRRPVRVDNVGDNRNFFPDIDEKTQVQTRSLMAAPLIHRETVLGVVEVINPIGRDGFDDQDLELLTLFANFAAAATRNAQDLARVSRENAGLRSAMPQVEVVGQSAALQQSLKLCKKVASAPTTALITGETGSGKEMAARTIHQHSPRADKPFIAVNCAALSETLMESELFGHEQGAFTGATERKLGRFELANGGTLFLDEVGEISGPSQTKLLRVLQEREFTRVGGTQTITCDVRIIAATNRDLKEEVESGRFREDLFYRLNIFPIEMPPLRYRREDVPQLVDHFIAQIAPQLGVAPPAVDQDALAALVAYDWPGNIRELRNVIERCTLLAEDSIQLSDLPHEIAHGQQQQQQRSALAMTPLATTPHASDQLANTPTATEQPAALQGDGNILAEHERQLLLQALEQTKWNQSAAARKLGVSRDHLRYRIKKYQLSQPQ